MSPARLTVRDYVATALVALIVIPYLGYLAWDETPVLQDPRALAGWGIALGLPAFVIIRGADLLDWTGLAEVGAAAVSLLLGIIALVLSDTAAAEVLLAAFMASILVVWLVEILDHRGVLPHHHVHGAA
jgi:hypothetical protein